jgi:DNA-binding NarL/FixJ family response regulator
VTALARDEIGEGASRDESRAVFVAGPRRVRLAMVEALGVWSDVTTRSGPSIEDLLACGAGAHQLVVAHCDTVSPEDAAVFKQLKCESPELLIVAVCGSADRRAVRRLIDSGVDGLVLFGQLEAALAPTVAAVFAGQMVVPRDLRVALDKPALSSRERQILSMVVTGLTNQEISSRMFLAESTVKSHLSSAYSKLGVHSRSEAAALILDRNGSLTTGIVAVAPNPQLHAA